MISYDFYMILLLLYRLSVFFCDFFVSFMRFCCFCFASHNFNKSFFFFYMLKHLNVLSILKFLHKDEQNCSAKVGFFNEIEFNWKYLFICIYLYSYLHFSTYLVKFYAISKINNYFKHY